MEEHKKNENGPIYAFLLAAMLIGGAFINLNDPPDTNTVYYEKSMRAYNDNYYVLYVGIFFAVIGAIGVYRRRKRNLAKVASTSPKQPTPNPYVPKSETKKEKDSFWMFVAKKVTVGVITFLITTFLGVVFMDYLPEDSVKIGSLFSLVAVTITFATGNST